MNTFSVRTVWLFQKSDFCNRNSTLRRYVFTFLPAVLFLAQRGECAHQATSAAPFVSRAMCWT